MSGRAPTGQDPIASVVIPAHNEGSVIERCLTHLLEGFSLGELEVVVACNGCTDDTADRVRRFGGVRVIELSDASKVAALNAGDDAVFTYPRIYLDADVVLPSDAAKAVIEVLQDERLMAARPPIDYKCERSSLLVRRYYRARRRVPAVMSSLWGAGAYGVSRVGRSRFGKFPDLVGDDLFVDQQFSTQEFRVIDCAPVVITVPTRSRDLLRMLRRVYRGKAENRAARQTNNAGTLSKAVGDIVRLATSGVAPGVDAVVYSAFSLSARVLARTGRTSRWERDQSSRPAVAV